MTLRTAPLRPLIVLLLAVVVAGSGCARMKGMFKDKDKNEGLPVSELNDKAHGYMENGRWSSAVEVWRRLIAQYPYGPYTEQALMETAYAEFKSGSNEDAISTIDRFLRTYPSHRNSAYMYYLRGLVNSNRDTVFLQRVWNLDASRRDLATPQQAYNDFSTVATRFPNSRYADDARARMVALRNMFARHEMDTTLYYMRRGAWLSAIGRAKGLLENYPQSAYQYDAIAALAESYTRLGNQALADDARRVLEQNDPNHPWLHGRDWPDYPSKLRGLNPLAGEKSALDNERPPEMQSQR